MQSICQSTPSRQHVGRKAPARVRPTLIPPRNATRPDCRGDCRLAGCDLYMATRPASPVHDTDLAPTNLSSRRNAHRALQTLPAVGTPKAKAWPPSLVRIQSYPITQANEFAKSRMLARQSERTASRPTPSCKVKTVGTISPGDAPLQPMRQ